MRKRGAARALCTQSSKRAKRMRAHVTSEHGTFRPRCIHSGRRSRTFVIRLSILGRTIRQPIGKCCTFSSASPLTCRTELRPLTVALRREHGHEQIVGTGVMIHPAASVSLQARRDPGASSNAATVPVQLALARALPTYARYCRMQPVTPATPWRGVYRMPATSTTLPRFGGALSYPRHRTSRVRRRPGDCHAGWPRAVSAAGVAREVFARMCV